MPDLYLDTVGQPSVIAASGKSLVLGAGGAASLKLNTDGSFTALGTTGILAQKTGLTNDTTAGNLTITAAFLLTGLITRDPNGAGRTDTTDTAANIIAGIPALSVDGAVWPVILINTADAAEAITLAGGTGVTISNVGQTIAQNESALLLFRRTSSTAITLYIIGA